MYMSWTLYIYSIAVRNLNNTRKLNKFEKTPLSGDLFFIFSGFSRKSFAEHVLLLPGSLEMQEKKKGLNPRKSLFQNTYHYASSIIYSARFVNHNEIVSCRAYSEVREVLKVGTYRWSVASSSKHKVLNISLIR